MLAAKQTNIIFTISAVALIFFATFLAYSNSFKSPFVFDDIDNIANNPFLHVNNLSLNSLKKAATETIASRHRFLPNISFALNYYFGGLQVTGYHAVNFIIHFCTATVFFFLARLTLGLPSVAGKIRHADEIALFAALLWAVHPVQTNAVTYIVQRMTSMAAFFFFGAVYCYVKGRILPANRKKIFYFAASFCSGILAIFSKENAAMLPFVILAYEIYFLSQVESFQDARKIIAGFFISCLVLLVVGFIYSGQNPIAVVLKGYAPREFTLGDRLLTEPRVIIHYLSLLALPLPARLNLNHDFEISHALLSPLQTFIAITGVMAFVGLALFLCRRERILSFAIVWYLANLVIESSVIPLEIIFEHRLYLPSTFLILGVICFVYLKAALLVKYMRPIFIALTCLMVFFTWQRNNVWSSEVGLWSDVISKSPNFVRGYEYLGRAYLENGETQKAYEIFRQARARNLESVHIFNNWGKAAFTLGRVDEAIKHLEHAVRLDPDHPESHYNLGIAYSSKGKLREAQEEMRKGIHLQMQENLRKY